MEVQDNFLLPPLYIYYMDLNLTILDTNSPKTMGILDASTYDTSVTGGQIIVTIPGFNSITIAFHPKSVNILNSNTLGLTSVTDYTKLIDVPDGIYKVSYTQSAKTINVTFLRVEKLRCKYENAILSSDMSSMKDFMQIEFLIQSAIASANKCNYDLAIELYRQASKEIDRLTD